jgi:hypothetical protein
MSSGSWASSQLLTNVFISLPTLKSKDHLDNSDEWCCSNETVWAMLQVSFIHRYYSTK